VVGRPQLVLAMSERPLLTLIFPAKELRESLEYHIQVGLRAAECVGGAARRDRSRDRRDAVVPVRQGEQLQRPRDVARDLLTNWGNSRA
jgi:hypothetical protein